MRRNKNLLLFLSLVGVACTIGTVQASDATSASFILRDAVIGAGGTYQSSTNFQMFSGSDAVLTGRAGTSTSFAGRFGFLYYPYLQKGTLTGTLNGTGVDLSWTATTASLGLQVSGYDTGISSTSGSGYSYTSVGLVTSHSYTALSPGTYYFVVRTLDGLGNVIAVSNEEMVIVPQIISFSISDTSIGFGTLSPSTTRYATGDTLGSGTETEAHQLASATNAPYGYSISIRGAAPTNGIDTIDSIGASNTSPSTGTDQFGLRLTATGGSGAVVGGYTGSGFAYDANATTPSSVATNAVGDAVTTTYSARYVANVGSTTTSGGYGTNLVYIVTANF